MKKTLFVALVGALAINANAGDYSSKTVTEAVAPAPALGATLSAGYMTNYIFYGVDLGEHGVWTGIDYSLDSIGIPLDIGAWYINPADGVPNDELDLYASYGLPSFAGFDATLNFLAYFFPESSADATYELNLGLTRSLGYVDMDISAHYDFEIEGWYFQTGISKEFGVTDTISLVVRASIGGQDDYYSSGEFFNDVQVVASLPIALTDNATLEPYIGGLWALDATDDFQDDIVHGGVSLSVSF